MKKGNLLVVEDEELLMIHLAENFEELADNIYTASNGKKALDVIKEKEIHCILCDLYMPEMDGFGLVQNIREDNNEVPVIFYSAYGNKKMMLEAGKLGAFDFLHKPDLNGLEETISRGLIKGTKKLDASESSFVSEYQVLMKNLGNSQE